MKTYKQTIEKPRLVIQYDDDSINPRENDNIGYFITCENRYSSPDKNDIIESIVRDMGKESNNLQQHIDNIGKMLKDELLTEILYIYPICKYEHSGVSYSLGEKHGFDYSNCGFFIVTKQHLDILGIKDDNENEIIRQIENELKEYNMYFNCEYYKFTLYDENGEFEEGYGNFETLEDIKAELGPEWKDEDMNDYLI